MFAEKRAWFRVGWWGLLTASSTAIVLKNWTAIFAKDSATAYAIVLGVWLVILLAPIFSEMDIGGIKVKGELLEVTAKVQKVQGELASLRLEIRNSFAAIQTQSVTVNAYPSALPTDAQVKVLRPKFEKALSEFEKILPPEPPKEEEARMKQDTEAALFYTVRSNVEREIRRISGIKSATIPVEGLAADLVKRGILTQGVAGLVKNTIDIASTKLHGEEVSKTQFEFVRDMGPRLVTVLQSVPS